jgi:hypothetical protein
MPRCHCLTVTCERGTYDEAVAALDAHRALTAPPEDESDEDDGSP